MADSDAPTGSGLKRSASPLSAPAPAPAPASDAASASTSAADPEPSSSSGGRNKRQRIDRRGDGQRVDDGEGNDGRLPKRPVALLFGYCGVGYSGLQINPGVKTIEGDIFDVLCNAGCVSKDNAVNPNKVSLQRSARTDRGVHAAGNLLNLKCILNPPASPSGEMKPLIEMLNAQLPPLIRIWNIVKVQSSFNARSSCDSRFYQYLIPTYVFLPPKPGSAMWNMYKRYEQDSEGIAEEEKRRLQQILYHPFWADALAQYQSSSAAAETTTADAAAATSTSTAEVKDDGKDDAPLPAPAEPTTFKEDAIRKRQYRLTADPSPYGSELLPRLRALWSTFIGTHNFHNFTVGKPQKDPSAKRVMKKMEISDPFIVDNTEYVSLTLHGQSFMLHQIRKMVGLIALIARSPAPGVKLLEKTLKTSDKIHVPKAPALGLLLNKPVFEGYNSKLEGHNAMIEKQFKEEKITEEKKKEMWREEITYEPFKEGMEAFRMQHIYQTQYETEEREDEFAKWLNYLDSIVGPDFAFLNPYGEIPKESVIAGSAPGGGSSETRGLGKMERAAVKKRKNREAREAAAAAVAASAPGGAEGEAAAASTTTAEASSSATPAEAPATGEGSSGYEYKESDDEDEAMPPGSRPADFEG